METWPTRAGWFMVSEWTPQGFTMRPAVVSYGEDEEAIELTSMLHTKMLGFTGERVWREEQ